MSETSYVDKNRFQFESKLLQNDLIDEQQYLRQKIDNQINQRLQSPFKRDHDAYFSPTHEDKPRRLVSPASIQERFISNSQKPTAFISNNHLASDSQESFSKSPIYQSPFRHSGLQYKGVESTMNVNYDLGKTQREQRRREIMDKINVLNEKLDQEANSRLNIKYCYQYDSAKNLQSYQIYDEMKQDLLSKQGTQQYQKPQISKNNTIPTSKDGGCQQSQHGDDRMEQDKNGGIEGREQLAEEIKQSSLPIKNAGEGDFKNTEKSKQDKENNKSNGLAKKDQGIQSNRGQLKQNERQDKIPIIKSETTPPTVEDIESIKLKQEIAQLQSNNNSLQQTIALLEKQSEEIQTSLKTKLKQSQDELVQIKDLQQKQSDEFQMKMEEGERKREIIVLQMQETQQALQEQMKDMEDALHTIKRSYEEKLQAEALKEFDIRMNAQTEKLLAQKDEIIKGLTQNNELKDIEANKMEELIGKFKDLFAQIKVEKEVLLSENENLTVEINQYKAYFTKLFANTNGQQNHIEEEGQGQYDAEYDEEHGQEGQEDEQEQEEEEEEEEEEDNDENHLTGEIPDQPYENDINPEEQEQYYLNQQQQQQYQENGEYQQDYQGENYQEEGDYEDEQQNIEQDYSNNQ